MASRAQRPRLASVWVSLVAALADLVAFMMVLWFAQFTSRGATNFDGLTAMFPATFGAIFIVVFQMLLRNYQPKNLVRFARSTGAAIIACLALFVVWLRLGSAPEPISLLLFICVFIIPLRLMSAFALRWAIGAGLFKRRAVIAGGGRFAEAIINRLAEHPDDTIHLLGIFDDRDDIRAPLQSVGVPKIGTYDQLLTFVRSAQVDMVIVALPLHAEDRINWLLDKFKVLPTEIHLAAVQADQGFTEKSQNPLIPVIGQSFSSERKVTKRIFDISIGLAALFAFAPIFMITALAIKIDSNGPIFFRQRRHGYNNQIVNIWKFRSMFAEATDEAATQVVTKGDARVTRVGRILRRSSIDELPQLFNVIGGSLSLVGPRPHAINAVSSTQEKFDRIVDGYCARHRLPPGITGWAQINGWRGEIDDPNKLRARFEHDLFYIENWSLWLDLKILFSTPLSLIQTKNAY